ncbi:MAG: hypothetical protein JNM56_13900, partial [Planctomycetia bacterium]|nr:hypothetical protein [Planctomycetia bacterium]
GAIAGGLVEVIRGVILLCSSDSVPPQPRTGAPAGRPSSAEQLVRNVHHAVAGDVLPSGTAVPSLSPATMVQATPAIPTAAASSRRVWPLLAGGVGVLFGLPLALAALGLLIRSWSGSSLPQVSPTAVRASGDWLVLFASDDPRIWNRDVDEGPNRFARSLFGVPNAVHYLRLRRGDDYVIIAMDKARLTQTSDDGHYGWEGTNHTDSGAHHLGIYSRVLPATGQGDISVRILPWCRGWGFGHRAFVNNGQGYCWDGKPIPPTVFEIAVKPGRLTAEESKRLLSR